MSDPVSPENLTKAVIGIDVGGTKMAWAAFEVNPDGSVGHQLTDAGGHHIGNKFPTPKGIGPLVEGYRRVLAAAQAELKGRAIIVGVGVVTPGRYIPKSTYTKKGYKPPQRLHMLALEYGDVGKTESGHHDLPWKPSNRVIANGTAQRIGTDPHEFDGVALEAVLQRVTPRGMQVTVNNDAAIQMLAKIRMIKQYGDDLTGKKTIYYGPGSGVGCAVKEKNGALVTDGHYQFISFKNERADAPDVQALFDEVSNRYQDEFRTFPNWQPGTVHPEHMFSGTDIARMLAVAMKEPEPQNPDQVDALMKELDRLHENGDLPSKVEAKMKAIGTALGDWWITLHSGDFHHMDPRSEWSDGDKAHVKGFEHVVLGGSLCCAPFFAEIILPAAHKVLEEQGLGQIQVHTSAKSSLIEILGAAAGTVSKEMREMPVADLARLQLPERQRAL